MNTMQMYDNVLTESIDLISFSKDNAANQHLQLIISLSFLLQFFFSFIKWISVYQTLSQLFLHFGVLPISIVSCLLPSSCPVQSPVQVFP